METLNEINRKIGKNLTQYRKAAKLTQAELAEKINYSDKSISKWESGNGAPDVYTLMQLSEIFGVSINQLVGEEAPPIKRENSRILHWVIMLLSSGIVWLVAICGFVAWQLWFPKVNYPWLCFLYAGLGTAVVLVVFSGLWRYRILNFISVSSLIWLAITCTYFTARFVSIQLGNDFSSLWCVYLLGVPLQILEVFWAFFRTIVRRDKRRRNTETEKLLEEADRLDEE